MKMRSKNLLIILVSLMFALAITSDSVMALEARQKEIIDSGAGWTDKFDPNNPQGLCSTNSASNRVYVIGDSLTIGMRDSGQLSQKLETAGWSVQGIQATESITVSGSLSRIDADADKVRNSDVVVVMLGTNKGSNFEAELNQMIRKIKDLAPAAQIHWMNAYTEVANYDDINGVIDAQAINLGYKVINWRSWLQSNPVNYPFAADGIHHTPAGYAAKADFLVGALGTPKPIGDNFSGTNNAHIAFNYFVSKGLSPEQSAGIVGNLIAESGVNPAIQQYGGGPGRGIAQWEVGGRWDTLLQFARTQQLDPLTIEAQLQYLWWELSGEPAVDGMTGGTESRAFTHLKTQSSVAGAAASFMIRFERPRDQSIARQQERARLAQPVYDQFAGGGGGGGGSAGGSCSSASSVSADGFYFPLETTKAAIAAGGANSEGVVLRWSTTCQSDCHHDYNAADIHVAPGTKVVAAKPGRVVMVRDRIGGGGSSVVIMGDDTVLYYYTHMAHGSIAIIDRQVVTGGQHLGDVGDSSQAMNTAAHLHFDALPGDQYTARPSCSSEACAGYPFINLAPVLSKLYEGLPD